MSLVTVYRFEVYDITTDGYTRSQRWGTREAIAAIAGARPLEDTGTEIDEAQLQSDIAGLTVRGFNPHQRRGFQTQVTS
jgi:hypothetical protein